MTPDDYRQRHGSRRRATDKAAVFVMFGVRTGWEWPVNGFTNRPMRAFPIWRRTDSENKGESWHLPMLQVWHTHIHVIPSFLLSIRFSFLPSLVWSPAILLLVFPFLWHPTAFFFFFIASCLTLTSHSPSLLCSFSPLYFSPFIIFFSRPYPSFLRELTRHNGALINEGLCLAMIAPVGWHHVTQSFLHITEGKGRTPPDSSISAQTYRTV